MINNIVFSGLNLPGSFQRPENKKINLNTSANNKSLAGDVFVSTDNSIKKPCITFTGLTSVLSKKAFSRLKGNEHEEGLSEAVEKHSKFYGNAGCYPASWLNKIPKNNFRHHLLSINSAFIQITDILRESEFKETNQRNDDIKRASKILTNKFVSEGIIKEPECITIDRLGSGEFGTAYKFNVNDEKFVLKVYKENTKSTDTHGPLFETNRALFITKNSPKSRNKKIARFHFANIKNGYMVEQFVESSNIRYQDHLQAEKDKEAKMTEKQKKAEAITKQKEFNEAMLGLKQVDREGNEVNGKLIDYGGFIVEEKLLAQNKTARWVYKKVIHNNIGTERARAWFDMLEKAGNNKIPNSKEIINTLVYCIQFLPDKDDRYNAFKEIIPLVDQKRLTDLANKVSLLPEGNKRFLIFKSLAQKADLDTSIALFYN
ncbi:MAG: hypothetical protein AB1782_06510, partial [Cyanobacteriota bacterium]